MKTHFDAEAPFDSIRMVAETPCGAGKGVSQYGLDATSNPALVDCKRCLKRIKDAEDFAADEKGRASDRAAMARNAGRAVAAHERAQQDAADEALVSEMEAKYPVTRIHPENPETVSKGEHVVAGPTSFWDVREAKTFVERQAFTTHNVYLAQTMVDGLNIWARGHMSTQIAALIEERDLLLYTKGDTTLGDGPTQYLAGRIAGLEFALAQFGVKGF